MITDLSNCHFHPNVKTKLACDRCLTSICEKDHKTKGEGANYEMYCLGCHKTMKYRNMGISFFIIIFFIGLFFGWTTSNVV